MTHSSKQTGITLTEMMIVLLIVGIISGIAYPIYTDKVQEARRKHVRELLTHLTTQQQRSLNEDGQLLTLSELGFTNNNITSTGHYTLALNSRQDLMGTDCNGCFNFTATARAEQLNDQPCLVFQIDNAGRKRARRSGGALNTDACWSL